MRPLAEKLYWEKVDQSFKSQDLYQDLFLKVCKELGYDLTEVLPYEILESVEEAFLEDPADDADMLWTLLEGTIDEYLFEGDCDEGLEAAIRWIAANRKRFWSRVKPGKLIQLPEIIFSPQVEQFDTAADV